MKTNSLYLHIPFCEQICAYCDFCKVFYNEHQADDYLAVLKHELQALNITEPLKTIYIGGGTPSSLNDEQLEWLMDIIKPYISSETKEVSIEVNPESIDYYKLDILKRGGVSRLSIGVETFNDILLKKINRQHTTIQVERIIDYARKIGFNNISIDLMYGLPNQTITDIKNDLAKVRQLPIEHISYYSLILEDHTVLKNLNYQPLDEEVESKITQLIEESLEQIGFHKYEISNFARHKHYSKHNQAYWHYEDFIGIGCGASGKQKHARYDNTRNLETYLRQGPSPSYIALTSKDERFEMIMMGLRLTQGISLSKFSKRFGCELLSCYENAVQKNIKLDLLRMENSFIKATDKGLHVLNSVLLDFMEG